MPEHTTPDAGLKAFQQRAWSDAFAELEQAEASRELTAEELERFALVAQFIGEDEQSARLWERAHQARLADDDRPRAARAAFWLGMSFFDRGEPARAGGWLARAQRLISEPPIDCVEQGYLRAPAALQLLDGGEPEAARRLFEEIVTIGERFADLDLITLGRLGVGQATIRLGDTDLGATRLDEVMISVLADDVSPNVAGIVYCAVVEAYQRMFDLHRAQEWTSALTQWCESQPDLVPFRGRCLVYRAEMMQMSGAWADAASEAARAFELLSHPPGQPAVGAASYCQAELHRLRGNFDEAETAFRNAADRGHNPQPGLAQLRLLQGRIDAAATAIRHALDETTEPTTRALLLGPATEIFLAAGDLASAGEAADELTRIARPINQPLLLATALQASGAVASAEDAPHEAAAMLREALSTWLALDVPYEAARTRLLLAQVARETGDDQAAESETALARATLEQLGAVADLNRLDAQPGEAGPPAGLTPREARVLELVATGMTNRAIADNLVISEKTVARHVSNIFAKLGVSSRAAATAYAYEHGLV